jgi:transcriptional regulator with XRE-family HTH domain
MLPRNSIGRIVSRLRSEQNWSQQFLATQLQCEGVDVSRDMLARIELGITRVGDQFLIGLQSVFRLPIVQFFPKVIQDLDEQFAREVAAQLSNRVPGKKPRRKNSRRKCQKLTKRRPPI